LLEEKRRRRRSREDTIKAKKEEITWKSDKKIKLY
jgi:hypothetical protein